MDGYPAVQSHVVRKYSEKGYNERTMAAAQVLLDLNEIRDNFRHFVSWLSI